MPYVGGAWGKRFAPTGGEASPGQYKDHGPPISHTIAPLNPIFPEGKLLRGDMFAAPGVPAAA